MLDELTTDERNVLAEMFVGYVNERIDTGDDADEGMGRTGATARLGRRIAAALRAAGDVDDAAAVDATVATWEAYESNE